jgi:glutamyl-tRNA reductase
LLLVLVGLNHRTAPIHIREKVGCSAHDLPGALTRLAAMPDISEGAILSTCNRSEVYACIDAPHSDAAFSILIRFLSALHDVPEAAFSTHLYRFEDRDAVRHLLRVAAGIDSLVLGEDQILGQVRSAHQAGLAAGTVGPHLNALFQQAIQSGRRVRNETALGRGSFSIGHAAVDLARSIFADLTHASILMLGAGKMSELTARHLQESGAPVVIVANRTYDHAVELAARLGGRAIQYDGFGDALVASDIVIASTSAPHTILDRKKLAPLVRRRRGRPLFLIDIAFPRDIDPDVNALDNVFLYNIDDLKAVVEQETRGREREVSRAENIADEETDEFLRWFRARAAAPVITQIQDRMESARGEEIRVLRAQLPGLTDREWQKIEAATRALARRLARSAILRLKEESGGAAPFEAQYDLLSAARELFALPGSAGGDSGEIEPASPAADNQEIAGEHPPRFGPEPPIGDASDSQSASQEAAARAHDAREEAQA